MKKIKNLGGIDITPDDKEGYFSKLFIPDSEIKFVTHGWTADEKSIAYLLNEDDINVVEIGWGSLSKNEYTMTTMVLKKVAHYVGKTILKILDEGVSELEKIHVIGHSLGAHVAGLIGGYIKSAGRGLVARVTADCAHSKAYHWYIASIHHSQAFSAVKCDSYMSYELRKCEGNEVAYMGANTSPSTRGCYYLTTNSTTSNEEAYIETSTLSSQ
ncbi:unnamed protein product [Nezara viridula]|uniref:Lipase domain-containing protein n=1 Tax=Nezara viridula TaxID=85310 RepID=A0A9P0MX46_NEZVI|nr:unnamed protein product [Nezara viridula]